MKFSYKSTGKDFFANLKLKFTFRGFQKAI